MCSLGKDRGKVVKGVVGREPKSVGEKSCALPLSGRQLCPFQAHISLNWFSCIPKKMLRLSYVPSCYRLSLIEPSRFKFTTIEPLCYREGKAIPVTVRGGPLGCETSRLPHFLDNRLIYGGEVSFTHRPPFTPRKIPGTHFC
jgi:hypothetical protein